MVVLAQEEARSLGHGFIAPEHIFLGLIREDRGLAARVLESLGVDYAAARADIVARLGQGDVVATGQIPFTPNAKKSLELSLREALSMKHGFIGTEHLLLGLSRAEPTVFAALGLTGDAVHEATVAAFSHEPGSP